MTDPLPSFKLPNIAAYTRKFFPYKCNPNHDEAESGAQAWFDGYGIYSGAKREAFFNSRFCLLASLCYPSADLAHLRPAMDFMLWLFSFDDMADSGEFSAGGLKLAVDATMNAISHPDSNQPEFIIAATIQSVISRMRANGNPATIKRFVDALRSYSRAIVKESSNKAIDRVETIEEYMRTRLDTSGVKLTLAMLEYAHGLDLTEEVHSDPVLAELALAGNEILSWANDIYSFPAENSRGQLHNFVYVVMQNNQLDLQGAVDYVNSRIQARVQEYVLLKAQLRSFGSPLDNQVALYIQGIEYNVQACIEWYILTPRYFGGDVVEIKEDGTIKLRTPIKNRQA